eukprot:Gb_23145 [translate_table: standard]
MELANRKCVPCKSEDIMPIPEQAANELLQQVPGWDIINEDGKPKLHRAWKMKSFKKGLEFFERVADVAETEAKGIPGCNHASIRVFGKNLVRELVVTLVDSFCVCSGGLLEYCLWHPDYDGCWLV